MHKHTLTHTEDMLTLGYSAVVVYRGKHAGGRGVALGWIDALDWANKACIVLLAVWLAGQLDANEES